MSSADEIKIEMSSLPKVNNPLLICGLPGSGYVGKVGLDYLIDKMHATQFANIYSNSFPPQVSIQADGTVDLVKNSLYHCKNNSSDLVLLTGDAQPTSAQGEYALAEKILGICKKLEINKVYTLAAFITGKFAKTPKVYGTATAPEIVKKFSEFGVVTMDRGNITGMNGVILGIAKQSNVSGVCLLGETSGYVIDAKASKAVLEILCKMLGIELDMTELNQRVKDTEELIKSIQAQAAAQGAIDPNTAMPSSPDSPPSTSNDKNLGYIS